MKAQVFRFTASALSFVAVIASSERALAQSQTIAGTPTPYNLNVTAYDNGPIAVDQYEVSSPMPRIGTTSVIPNKGLYVTDGTATCTTGFFGRSNQVPVSNSTPSPDTIITVIDCTTMPIRIIQKVIYPGFGKDVQYDWAFVNTSPNNTINNLTVIHGSDLNLGSTDFGPGFIDLANHIVGRIGSTSGTSQHSAVFWSPVPPVAAEADSPTAIQSNTITTSHLNNQTALGDTAYAMEWASGPIPAGEAFVVTAFEQFSYLFSPSDLALTSPLTAATGPGSSANIMFRIDALSAAPEAITNINVSVVEPGWSATLIAPPTFPLNIPGNGNMPIAVQVSAPTTATINDRGTVILNVTTSLATLSESAVITIFPPTPTPTATATATATPVIPTPTATPTDTPTLTPTPTATPTQLPIVAPSIRSPKRSTRFAQPPIAGRSAPAAAISIVIDNNPAIPAVADANGNWSTTVPFPLDVGPHTLMVTSTDPLGRTSTLDAPFKFSVTRGARLDFDGDGVSDITTYTASASRVAFRWTRSSDGSSATTILPGRVPAPGDYDGDGATDFATIVRNGTGLDWTVRYGNGNSVGASFGSKGSLVLTGCAFNEAKKTSLALLTNNSRSIQARTIDNASPVNFSIAVPGKIIGCIDGDLDGLDELIVQEDVSDDKIKLSLVARTGEAVASDTAARFDRGYSVRAPSTPAIGEFVSIRLIGPATRRGALIAPDDSGNTNTITFDLPRKLIGSEGTALSPDGYPVDGFAWQDLKTGDVFGRELTANATPSKLAKISNRSSIVQSSYIYRTTSQR